MSTDLRQEGLEADLTRIVKDIFLTMAGMQADAGKMPPSEQQEFPVMTASMHLGGAWNGAIVMQCPLSAACEITAAMIGVEKPAAADDDVKDVMGELVNMVAGTLKGLLGGAHLSLPTVVEGLDYRFCILRGKPAAQLGFQTSAGPIYVSLVELEGAPSR